MTHHDHIRLSTSVTDEEANSGEDNSSNLPWNLIGAGMCVLVIVIGIVSAVGIATYAYRHRNKQRQRRYVVLRDIENFL